MERTASVESERSTVLSALGKHEARKKRLREVEQEKLAVENALSQANELNRRREAELAE